MFSVEKREVGQLLWEKHHQDEDMLKAEIAKENFKTYFRLFRRKGYEWRVREIEPK